MTYAPFFPMIITLKALLALAIQLLTPWGEFFSSWLDRNILFVKHKLTWSNINDYKNNKIEGTIKSLWCPPSGLSGPLSTKISSNMSCRVDPVLSLHVPVLLEWSALALTCFSSPAPAACRSVSLLLLVHVNIHNKGAVLVSVGRCDAGYRTGVHLSKVFVYSL